MALRDRAPAKLNLGLQVLGRRPDGYHELDSLFVRLALADTLELLPLAASGSDRLERLPAGDAWLDRQPLSLAGDNLVLHAIAAYRSAAGAAAVVVPPLLARLTKRIPWGAGLAGGSADAAAALRLLDRHWPADLDLAALAARLGSDIPFCLADLKAARVAGRGERMEPLALPTARLLLLYPNVAVSTPEAFRWWGVTRPQVPAVDLAGWWSGLPVAFPNALEGPVAERVPAVARALALLRALDAGPVAMSGSGSTCYLLLRDPEAGEYALAAARKAAPDAWLCLTESA
jgi:4-diphosphocytidyl-2-C-methyl-D-erythritol kinase